MSNRKRWIALFLLLSLLFASLPSAASNGDGRVYFETVFEALDRDLRQENTQFAGENFPEAKISAQSLRLLGKLGIRVADPLELYGLLGGSTLDIDDVGFNPDMGGAYGGGLRVVLFRDRNPRRPLEIFADYRFLEFKVNDSVFFDPTIVDNAGNLVHLLGAGGERVPERIRWREQVLKFGLRGSYYEYEPYGGIRFTFVDGRDHIETSIQNLDLSLKEDDVFGLFFGTLYYLSPTDAAALFIEASLVDPFSLSGGIRIGF